MDEGGEECKIFRASYFTLFLLNFLAYLFFRDDRCAPMWAGPWWIRRLAGEGRSVFITQKPQRRACQEVLLEPGSTQRRRGEGQ